jgi:hypothetical protein
MKRRVPTIRFIRALAMATAALAPLAPELAIAQARTEVVTVAVRPGVTMKYLEIKGDARPSATVILMAGGKGVLDLRPSGEIGTDLNLNFLMRARDLFVREGFVVSAVDVASDQLRGGLNGDIRLSAPHGQDLMRVIGEARTRNPGPVWLIGTSASVISVAAVAARFPKSKAGPDGAVLTSSLTVLAKGLCGRSIYFAPLAAIRVPVLSIGHQDDACPCSPGGAEAGQKLMTALKGAAAKEHKVITGGDPPLSKSPCHARTPHGFFGKEEDVVKAIAAWIAKH